MTNNIYGFPYLCIYDENASSEHMVSYAFSYITRTLCSIDTLCRIKCNRLAIQRNADRPDPLCAPKAMNFWQYEDFRIFLTYSTYSWCQMIYQLSHEVNHMIMGCAPANRKYQWIAEVLCEMASLIVLKELTNERQNLFFPDRSTSVFEDYLSDYRTRFADDTAAAPDQYLLQYASTLSDPEFREDGVRKRNSTLALWLVDAIPFSTKAWNAVSQVRRISLKDDPSYPRFFTRWYAVCQNGAERGLVNTIFDTLYRQRCAPPAAAIDRVLYTPYTHTTTEYGARMYQRV